jgi:hypothetical protein
MPYNGIQESDWPKMEKCVAKVMATGKKKPNAIAICHASIMGKKELSIDDAITNIRDDLYAQVGSPNNVISSSLYLFKLYANYAIFEKDSKYYRVDYEIDVNGKAVVKSDLAEVQIFWMYVKEAKETDVPIQTFEKKIGWLPKLLKALDIRAKPKITDIEEDEEEKDSNDNMLLWKDKSGNWRWFAMWSNKYRDYDTPQEILADASHIDFVQAIDNKEWAMPELWHWHVPGTRWGIADWVAYDDKGFILASGTVDKGHEKEALAVKNTKLRIKVSHGMPESEIRRDEKDNTIITRYRTIEISDLPFEKAANQLTAFAIRSNKENIMAIPSEKLEYLKEVGLTDEDIVSINAAIASGEKSAKVLNLDSKEADTQDTPPDAQVNQDAEVVAPETKDVTPPKPEIELVGKNEVADALMKLTGIVEENTKTLLKEVEDLKTNAQALVDRVAILETADDAKIGEKALNTPSASLADLIGLSVIGKELARVDKRTQLAKDKPLEAKEDVKVLPGIGIPFIDEMLSAQSN